MKVKRRARRGQALLTASVGLTMIIGCDHSSMMTSGNLLPPPPAGSENGFFSGNLLPPAGVEAGSEGLPPLIYEGGTEPEGGVQSAGTTTGTTAGTETAGTTAGTETAGTTAGSETAGAMSAGAEGGDSGSPETDG